MSDSEEQTTDTTEEKKKSPLGVILIIFAAVAIFVGLGLANNAKNAKQNAEMPTTETAEAGATESDDGMEITTETAQVEPFEPVELDLESLGTPRILGNPNAPVKITEHSSFTCPACALFHKSNFKDIKKDYIDTGKAYIVFDDFPRNAYDIAIGSIARCVPDEAYFNFVQLIFETQKEWLVDQNYQNYMKQNAKLTGADSNKIETCEKSEELHKILANRQAQAFENHEVNSTPTLIINDTVKVSGLDAYDKIQAAIDSELAKAAE